MWRDVHKQQIIKKLKTTKHTCTNWSIMGGILNKKMCEIHFTFPLLHEHQEIKWKCYVNKSDIKSLNYDLIFGRDIVQELGINLCFNTAEIKWDNASIPMQSSQKLDGEFCDFLSKNYFTFTIL